MEVPTNDAVMNSNPYQFALAPQSHWGRRADASVSVTYRPLIPTPWHSLCCQSVVSQDHKQLVIDPAAAVSHWYLSTSRFWEE